MTPGPDAERTGAERTDGTMNGELMNTVLVLNGPNLGRLGKREPDIYGHTSHADLADHLVASGRALGLVVDVRQTDHEGEMCQWLHEAADLGCWVVINAGADAAAQVDHYVEVHISNVYARESFRQHSVLSAKASGVMVGFGLGGYDLALAHIAATLGTRPTA